MEPSKLSKEQQSAMYDRIDEDELYELIDNAEFIRLKDNRNLGENAMLIEATYGPTPFAGVTDYKDHRNDSMKELKELFFESIKTRKMQRGHYYDWHGNPFDKIALIGQNAGWTSYAVFGDSIDASFFQSTRKNTKEKMKEKGLVK